MATTPLQLAQGVATIAMHGKRFRPHLLRNIKNHDGTLQKIEPIPLADVKLKNQELWGFVINAMREVIKNPQGTAYQRFAGWNLPYSVAGKTGEAQLYRKSQSNIKTPKHLLNHNLFIAFAPVEAPRIAVAVVSENSNLAIKTTRQILDRYLLKDSSSLMAQSQ
jgi:penicillin-binding protein 2